MLYAPEDGEYAQQTGSEYWYEQEQQGRVLTGVQKEWADMHAQQLKASEQYTFHANAYLDAARKYGITGDPVSAAELAETLEWNEDVRHWLTVAAEEGDTDAIRRLIDEFDHHNLQRCWMWLYLAELHGVDLTRSHLQAFHDGGIAAGEIYDDDIGGPLYVSGDEGVELEPLNDEELQEARMLADAIYRRTE